MQEKKYDLVVIGAGPGGYVAAIHAAELGLKVVCIDKSESLGGTCLNVGCIPSKALLQSTEQYEWLLKSSKDHGIKSTGITLDFSQLMQRKQQIVNGLVGGIATQFKNAGVDRLLGSAHFTGPNTIDVVNGDLKESVYGANIIIATGSQPIELPFLPFDEKVILSSTGALSLAEIPKRMVVIGGGVIGVELASVYNRLGTQVTIVEMLDGLTPMMEPSVSRALLQTLTKQGIQFYLSAKVTSAKKDTSGVTLSVEHEGKSIALTADVILVAVGRRPFTAGLNLEAAGIKANSRGFLDVDNYFRTSQKHIYAIGDVTEGVMLAHKASSEGITVVEIIKGNSASLNYAAIPNVIYTHPEVASVGLTESEVKAAGLTPIVGTSFFKGNPRARCNGDVEGFVKVVGDQATGRLLGLHIIGPHASELIAEGVVAIEKRATVHEIARSSHAHPTLSETIMEAAAKAKS